MELMGIYGGEVKFRMGNLDEDCRAYFKLPYKTFEESYLRLKKRVLLDSRTANYGDRAETWRRYFLTKGGRVVMGETTAIVGDRPGLELTV